VVGLDDEVREILRELVAEIGAASAEITDSPEERSGVPSRTVPLGDRAYLRVEMPTRSERFGDVEANLERAARALRAAARRWETELPPVLLRPGHANRREKVSERVGAFLSALAAVQNADNALVVLRGHVVAAARPLGALEEARWPFIAKRALAAGEKSGTTSHAELADPDFFALTFWYGAVLIVYFTGPYSVDFVRHRAKRVARELAELLPDLEPEPTTPATAIRPPRE
jgi:hypothetical protein